MKYNIPRVIIYCSFFMFLVLTIKSYSIEKFPINICNDRLDICYFKCEKKNEIRNDEIMLRACNRVCRANSNTCISSLNKLRKDDKYKHMSLDQIGQYLDGKLDSIVTTSTIYRWKDGNGKTHITNNFSTIPTKFKNKSEEISIKRRIVLSDTKN